MATISSSMPHSHVMTRMSSSRRLQISPSISPTEGKQHVELPILPTPPLSQSPRRNTRPLSPEPVPPLSTQAIVGGYSGRNFSPSAPPTVVKLPDGSPLPTSSQKPRLHRTGTLPRSGTRPSSPVSVPSPSPSQATSSRRRPISPTTPGRGGSPLPFTSSSRPRHRQDGTRPQGSSRPSSPVPVPPSPSQAAQGNKSGHRQKISRSTPPTPAVGSSGPVASSSKPFLHQAGTPPRRSSRPSSPLTAALSTSQTMSGSNRGHRRPNSPSMPPTATKPPSGSPISSSRPVVRGAGTPPRGRPLQSPPVSAAPSPAQAMSGNDSGGRWPFPPSTPQRERLTVGSPGDLPSSSRPLQYRAGTPPPSSSRPSSPWPTPPSPSQEESGHNPVRRRPFSPSTPPTVRSPPVASPGPSTSSLRPLLLRAGTPPRSSTRPSSPVPGPSSSPFSVLRSARYLSDGTGSKRRVTLSSSHPEKKSPIDDNDDIDPLEDSNTSLQVDLKSDNPPVSMKHGDQSRVVEVTEFHKYICDKNWVMLDKALKRFNGKHYKRMQERAERQREKLKVQQQPCNKSNEMGDPPSDAHRLDGSVSPQRRSMRLLDFLAMSRTTQTLMGENVQEKIVVSPLLKVDDEGRTPLHLAYLNECPDATLLNLQNEERMAAKQHDNHRQLPLHLAMIHQWPSPLLEKLINIHPNALKSKDLQGRTPLGYSVELAIQEQTEKFKDVYSVERFRWGKPISDAEKAWQQGQTKIWSRVEFLLKDLMRRKKNVIPSEHGLLLEAIEVGAPSAVINRLISTTDKYLKLDDEFAGNALAMCVGRQYSLDTLEYLVEFCREGTTVIQDYTEKALIAHYRRGCLPGALDSELPSFGHEIVNWCKSNSNRGTVPDQERASTAFLTGVSTMCQEWWEMLRYLLFVAAYGKNFVTSDKGISDIHMLHAAVSISSTPPSLVQLILVIFPESRNELCPLYKALPVHLICIRWRYDALRNDKDTSMEKVLKMFLKADTEQVVRRYKGRRPLHMALMAGQSWTFVKSILQFDKTAVGIRDPSSKMFPFQLAALKWSSKGLAMMLRQRYTPAEWKTAPPAHKQMEFDLAKELQARRQIGTIFELLRHHPGAIVGRYLLRDSSTKGFDIHNAGQISMHYLSLIYRPDENGWKQNASFVRLLRDSIVNGSIARPLGAWWHRMKEFIWETTPSDIIPFSDEYLLHAALYNPDTPPTIIELLIQLFPVAASKPIPGTRILPLHIAAGTVPYHPQKFEVPYSTSSLELTLNSYKQATRVRVNRQLAIHIALSRGKTWKEIEPLVRQDRQTLLVKDPISKLTPVEQIASYRITTFNNMCRYAQIVDYETRGIDIEGLPAADRARVLRNVKRTFDLNVLSTIYELLRHALSALPSTRFNVSDNVSSVSSVTHLNSSSDLEEAVRDNVNETVESRFLTLVDERPVFVPRRGTSLASYLEGTRISHAESDLSQPREVLYDDGPVRTKLDSSSSSLMSRTCGDQPFEDYFKPNYSDDNISSMGTSLASLGVPTQMVSGGFNMESPTVQGRQPLTRNLLPDIPNLDDSRQLEGI